MGRNPARLRRHSPVSSAATAGHIGQHLHDLVEKVRNPLHGRGSPRPGAARRVPGSTGPPLQARGAHRRSCSRESQTGLSALAEQPHHVLVGGCRTHHARPRRARRKKRSIATSACAAMDRSIPFASGSQPPVSTSQNRRSIHSALYVDAVARDSRGVFDPRLRGAPRTRFTSWTRRHWAAPRSRPPAAPENRRCRLRRVLRRREARNASSSYSASPARSDAARCSASSSSRSAGELRFEVVGTALVLFGVAVLSGRSGAPARGRDDRADDAQAPTSTFCSKSRSVELTTVTPRAAVRKSTTAVV